MISILFGPWPREPPRAPLYSAPLYSCADTVYSSPKRRVDTDVMKLYVHVCKLRSLLLPTLGVRHPKRIANS